MLVGLRPPRLGGAALSALRFPLRHNGRCQGAERREAAAARLFPRGRRVITAEDEDGSRRQDASAERAPPSSLRNTFKKNQSVSGRNIENSQKQKWCCGLISGGSEHLNTCERCIAALINERPQRRSIRRRRRRSARSIYPKAEEAVL